MCLLACMHVCMLHICVHVHLFVLKHLNMEESEDNFWESALSNCVGPQDQSQVVMLGSKLFYLLSHLACPKWNFSSQGFPFLRVWWDAMPLLVQVTCDCKRAASQGRDGHRAISTEWGQVSRLLTGGHCNRRQSFYSRWPSSLGIQESLCLFFLAKCPQSTLQCWTLQRLVSGTRVLPAGFGDPPLSLS